MKKASLLLALALSTTLTFGQNSERVVDYYGIDYSLAKVQGTNESPYVFKDAFYRINTLILDQYPKFNIAKFLGEESIVPNLDFVQKRNLSINEGSIPTRDFQYTISYSIMDSLVKTIDVTGYKNDVGVVIFCELLSKTSHQGYYMVVYFENNTKKIISSIPISGKAGGAGVRNFWASSFLNAIKSYNKMAVRSRR